MTSIRRTLQHRGGLPNGIGRLYYDRPPKHLAASYGGASRRRIRGDRTRPAGESAAGTKTPAALRAIAGQCQKAGFVNRPRNPVRQPTSAPGTAFDAKLCACGYALLRSASGAAGSPLTFVCLIRGAAAACFAGFLSVVRLLFGFFKSGTVEGPVAIRTAT